MANTDPGQVILEEYKICSERADRLTALIWTWATALLGLNAAVIAVLGRFAGTPATGGSVSVKPEIFYSTETYWLVAIVAVLAVFIIAWWGRAADRWHSIIAVWYNRMQKLEGEIRPEMRVNRDLNMLDELKKEKGCPDFGQFSHLAKDHSTLGLKELRWQLELGIYIGWLALLTWEAYLSIIKPEFCNPVTNSNCEYLFLIPYLFILAILLWRWWRVLMGRCAHVFER